MSIAEVQQLDEQGMAAWDQHKADDFVVLFSDNFTFSDVTLPEALRSKDQVRQYMETWFTAFPDIRVQSINRVVSEDAVAGEFEFTGTNAGPFVAGGHRNAGHGQERQGHRHLLRLGPRGQDRLV